MKIKTNCPCCGQATEMTGVVVSLDSNVVAYKDKQTSQLPGRVAEMAFVLAKRMPGSVSQDELIRQIWALDEPEYSEKCIHVYASKLRKVIRPLGLEIKNIYGGYRLAAAQA